jgi:hypothetical protein
VAHYLQREFEICMDEMEPSAEVVQSVCTHRHHKDCMDVWLRMGPKFDAVWDGATVYNEVRNGRKENVVVRTPNCPNCGQSILFKEQIVTVRIET